MATPLTKVITNPTTPDPLTCCWMCLCWFPPSAWVTPLHLHLITLWARESSQSSRAKVTSSDSHSEVSYSPGAEVEYLNLSELQEGTSFQCSNSTQLNSTELNSTQLKWRNMIRCVPPGNMISPPAANLIVRNQKKYEAAGVSQFIREREGVYCSILAHCHSAGCHYQVTRDCFSTKSPTFCLSWII